MFHTWGLAYHSRQVQLTILQNISVLYCMIDVFADVTSHMSSQVVAQHACIFKKEQGPAQLHNNNNLSRSLHYNHIEVIKVLLSALELQEKSSF